MFRRLWLIEPLPLANGRDGWRADLLGWLTDDVVAQKKRTLMIAAL
jgi:hypothetical protein